MGKKRKFMRRGSAIDQHGWLHQETQTKIAVLQFALSPTPHFTKLSVSHQTLRHLSLRMVRRGQPSPDQALYFDCSDLRRRNRKSENPTNPIPEIKRLAGSGVVAPAGVIVTASPVLRYE